MNYNIAFIFIFTATADSELNDEAHDSYWIHNSIHWKINRVEE